jgi:surface antigen
MATNTAIQNFKNNWSGRRVDYDNVYSYQCVDLILQYLKECYGLRTGVWGNAIDYWYKPTGALLAQFNRVDKSNHPLVGDIAILNGVGGNPYGHIGIVYSADANNITILEQNGSSGNGSGTGGDAIRLRSVPKSRLAGYLRQKAAVPINPSGTATVISPCYVRTAPNTAAPLGGSRNLVKGDTFQYARKVAGQSVGGNNVWYQSTKGNYVWSGNARG